MGMGMGMGMGYGDDGMMVVDGGCRKGVICWCGKGVGNMCECVIILVYVFGYKGYKMGDEVGMWWWLEMGGGKGGRVVGNVLMEEGN